MFNNIKDAISWLEHQPRFKEKTDLEHIKSSYQKLNINWGNTKKIHIAGTNGKGSTTAFLSNILKENKLKVGSFTSPYLINFNERLKINNENIEDEKLLKYINFIYQLNEKVYEENGYKHSFFELLTLMAFKYFYDEKVDVFIMETGIGGRLDATNIINYDVSIITSIGFDHVKQLGNSLQQIAKEKLLILKPNGHLISSVEIPIKTDYINYANKIKASFKFIRYRDIFPYTPNSFYYLGELYEISLLGDYQRMNALLAIEAANYLYNIDKNIITKALKTTKWPGRFEEISKDVYIDGAHNINAIDALARNINYIFRNKKITILFSALKDKDIKPMIDRLKDISNNIILTSFDDFRYESLEKYSNSKNIKYKENGLEVFKELINNKKDDEIIIATGSLHFIGYLKQNI